MSTRPDRAAGPARLEIDDLVVSFGGVRAVDHVTLHAEPGSIVGLIGPNGSGKTTVLDAVSGLVAPTSGAVRVDGAEVGDYLPGGEGSGSNSGGGFNLSGGINSIFGN